MAYEHEPIEQKWQQFWEQHGVFRAERRPGRPKYYVLDMFPYPSGSGLHVGHPEGYTATDIVARYKRMNGFDVLHPMGWDAFGLPAEQHAIQTGTHPAVTTQQNIATFRRQLKSLGFSYDWDREVDTTDPGYVRWTQWIFLKLFERKLAFQAEIPVNWCAALGTVLANEEVIDGKSERGNYPVVRLPLRQWQLRITAYAEQLDRELEPLDWPETKQKQRDWIGRSEGAEIDFAIEGSEQQLTVYTTRPDTLFGATYVVVAPDHKLTLALVTEEQRPAVEAYVEAARRKSDLERTAQTKTKTGVFTGRYARNPVNDARIPVYTADYVLGAYGTGAVMAVPAHDERDFEFARQLGLPIIEVVSPDGTLHESLDRAYTDSGVMVRSGQFDGTSSESMRREVVAWLSSRGAARPKANTKLRDWVFSRQRYWGEPIPIYFPVRTEGDPRQGAPFEVDFSQPIAVEESELPLRLPDLADFKPGDDPAGPLARALDWRFFQKGGRWYARETNTMPQWAGSCWYYLRYIDPKNTEQIFSDEAYDSWMPVDLYMGGAEHAVLHLLYARFWHKVLYDVGVVKHPEPFLKLVHQGMILGEPQNLGFKRKSDAEWVSAEEVLDEEADPIVDRSGNELELVKLREDELEPRPGGFRVVKGTTARVHTVAMKMSKSRGNVVNPDSVVKDFGADSLRVYEMFMGPLEQVKPWQTAGLRGVRRFLDRVHQLATRPLSDGAPSEEIERLLHKLVKKVGEDIESMRFNTAVSSMMEAVNALTALESVPRVAVERLLLCLAPFAPHLAEELWCVIGNNSLDAPEPVRALTAQAWPSFDPALTVDDVVEMGVQVGGKVRGRISLSRTASEEEAKLAGSSEPNVAKFLEGKQLVKFVYVPGRIVNFIVK